MSWRCPKLSSARCECETSAASPLDFGPFHTGDLPHRQCDGGTSSGSDPHCETQVRFTWAGRAPRPVVGGLLQADVGFALKEKFHELGLALSAPLKWHTTS